MDDITPPARIRLRQFAAAPIAQARLFLFRLARQTSDPHQARTLLDLAGVLQYVISELEQLMDTSDTGGTR